MTARDPLNFISPYERLPAGHENQLTRVLRLLLRLQPARSHRMAATGRPEPATRRAANPHFRHELPAADAFRPTTRGARAARARATKAVPSLRDCLEALTTWYWISMSSRFKANISLGRKST